MPAVSVKKTTLRACRDALAALSLANLVFIRVWAELLTFEKNDSYWIRIPPTPAHYAALIINVVVLSALLYRFIGYSRQHRNALALVVPLLLLIPLLNAMVALAGSANQSLFLRFVQQRTLLFVVAAPLLWIVAYLAGGPRVVRFAIDVLVVVFPFVVLTFSEAAWKSAHYHGAFANGAPAPRLPAKAGAPHVLWVIFDEWDYRLTLGQRPPDLPLPELDRLRGEAYVAQNAYAPEMMTDFCMPGLITGRHIVDVATTGPNDLRVWPEKAAEPVLWSAMPNVFQKARALGFNTAVYGWSIPYCRVLAGSLTDCEWWSGSNQYNSTGWNLASILPNQVRSLFETIYRSPFGQSLSTQRHARTYVEMLEKAKEAGARRPAELILLHLPIPHPPYFYNAATGAADYGAAPVTGIFRQSQKGYLGALRLADRTIGDLRRVMESAGTWDDSTVLISADHAFRHSASLDHRPTDRRVPFVLKLAGQKRGAAYAEPFSTLLTQALLLDVLRGVIPGPEAFPAWLDRHRSEYAIR